MDIIKALKITGRKGVVFTLLSLVVASFFLIIFSGDVEIPLDQNVNVISFRVNIMDRYRQSFEDFAAHSVRASSYRALQMMAEFAYQWGYHWPDQATFERNFAECMLNGTITPSLATANCSGTGAVSTYTLPFMLNQVAALGNSNLSINTTYEIINVTLSQQFAFHVSVDVYMNYTVSDSIARISNNITVSTLVPIEGIREPLSGVFEAFTSNDNRFIKETATKNSEWNQANFTNFVTNREYRYSPFAPSFLNRFLTSFATYNSTCCGIETVLSEDPAIDGVLFLENRSYMDWMYFRDRSSATFPCDEVYSIVWMPDVQLDQETLASFNITPPDWIISC